MKTFDVITIGNATLDIVLQSASFRTVQHGRRVEFLLPLGEKLDVETVVAASGGGATNAAATFANFGYHVGFFGMVGDDANGRWVLDDLRRRKIDTSLVALAPGATPVSVILSAKGSGRTVLTHRPVTSFLTPRVLRTAHARWWYGTSLSGNLPLLQTMLRMAKTARSLVAFNPGALELRRPRALRPLLRSVSVLLLNREEAAQLAGRRGTLVQTVKILAPLVRGFVVITDGERGSAAATRHHLYRARTHVLPRVAEWTGAGDAFGSGFVCGLLASNGDPVVALQFATANAEGVIQRVGAKNGLCTRPPRPRQRIPVRVSTYD